MTLIWSNHFCTWQQNLDHSQPRTYKLSAGQQQITILNLGSTQLQCAKFCQNRIHSNLQRHQTEVKQLYSDHKIYQILLLLPRLINCQTSLSRRKTTRSGTEFSFWIKQPSNKRHSMRQTTHTCHWRNSGRLLAPNVWSSKNNQRLPYWTTGILCGPTACRVQLYSFGGLTRCCQLRHELSNEQWRALPETPEKLFATVLRFKIRKFFTYINKNLYWYTNFYIYPPLCTYTKKKKLWCLYEITLCRM